MGRRGPNKNTLRKIRLRANMEKTKATIRLRKALALQGLSFKVEDNHGVNSSHGGDPQVFREEEVKIEPEEVSSINCLETQENTSSFSHPKTVQLFPNEVNLEVKKISGRSESEASGSKWVIFTPSSKSRTVVNEKRSCFVCESPTSSAANKRTPPEIFEVLLENILELPIEVIQGYNNQCGGAFHKWIRLCQACLNEITEAKHIREQILHLEKRFLKKQMPVVKKIKKTCKMNPQILTDSSTNVTTLVLEEIRKYVYQRKYEEDAEQKLRNQLPSRIINPMERPGIEVNDQTDIHSASIEDSEGDEDDEYGIEEEVPLDIDEFASANSRTNPVQVTGSDGVPSQVYFCGLCDEFRGFSSEKELTAHQNEAHWASDDGNGEIEEIVPRTKKYKRSTYVYSCPNCPQVKDYSITRYAQHLAFHLRRPYRCSECQEFLPEDSDIRDQHWKDRHGEKQQALEEKFIKVKLDPGQIWKCRGCLEGFFTEGERDIHQIGNICGEVSMKRKSLPISCSICSISFQERNEWRLHRLLFHPEVDSVSCLFCDESFAAPIVDTDGVIARNDYKMVEHINSAHKWSGYQGKAIPLYLRSGFLHEECELCGITLPTKVKSLSRHLETRHGRPMAECIPPLQCKYCLKRFSQLSSVRSHMAKHHFRSEGTVCEVCGVEVISKDKLIHHKFSQHGIIPEGMEVLECTEPGCEFKAVEKWRLTNHARRTHYYNQGNPKYVCKYCGKSCKTKGQYTDHMNTHENKESKPFQCEICGNSFAVRNYLYIHKRLTHEKRFFPSTNKKKPPRKKKVPITPSLSKSRAEPALTDGSSSASHKDLQDMPNYKTTAISSLDTLDFNTQSK